MKVAADQDFDRLEKAKEPERSCKKAKKSLANIEQKHIITSADRDTARGEIERLKVELINAKSSIEETRLRN